MGFAGGKDGFVVKPSKFVDTGETFTISKGINLSRSELTGSEQVSKSAICIVGHIRRARNWRSWPNWDCSSDRNVGHDDSMTTRLSTLGIDTGCWPNNGMIGTLPILVVDFSWATLALPHRNRPLRAQLKPLLGTLVQCNVGTCTRRFNDSQLVDVHNSVAS